jgi:hypothetical protein
MKRRYEVDKIDDPEVPININEQIAVLDAVLEVDSMAIQLGWMNIRTLN